MPLQLDHVFVCCDAGGPEAAALLEHGIREGTPNVHPGQGTACRRFFFDTGFFELFWVTDPAEAQSASTRRTRLWERWSGRTSGACPFGLAFRPSGDADEAPPFPTWSYKPKYLPAGATIEFVHGADLREPELFLMVAQPPNTAVRVAQPTNHAAPLRRMIAVDVGLPDLEALSAAASAAARAGLVTFHKSARYELTLKFTSPVDVRIDLRPTLPVTLVGSPLVA